MQSLRILILIILVNSIGQLAKAQDTLPSFTVKNKSGKVIVSWTNNYPAIKQISIQRSPDSAKGFRSILTVPDPKAIKNGYLDSKAPDTVSYYRLFLLLDSSHYVFTSARKPVRDTIVAVVPPTVIVAPAVTPQLVVDTTATVSVDSSARVTVDTTATVTVDTTATVTNTRVINRSKDERQCKDAL